MAIVNPMLRTGAEGIHVETVQETLLKAQLYVLIDGCASLERFVGLVRSLVAAGVQVLQLRDKKLCDRKVVERARLIRQLTRDTKTLFIVNDRPDIALLADADGVHVGQGELTVADCRTILGRERLIGVSTHSVPQAQQAVGDGADYVGCGPTFPSATKEFAEFPGLGFLRAVRPQLTIPAFAIGGIQQANVAQVLDTGLRRIAVSSAVTAANDPSAAATSLLDLLRGS